MKLAHYDNLNKKPDHLQTKQQQQIRTTHNKHKHQQPKSGNLKEFKTVLKQFLYTYSFYTFEEYFNQI
jgi:hypothetical protein